ncbi:MAG TPA: phosphatase PAP2 family protein [Terriglobia bacterium]|nr:phosphatase PAP2 family protein [Terriglobia bacterium]
MLMSRCTCRLIVLVLALSSLGLNSRAQDPLAFSQGAADAGSARSEGDLLPERPVSFKLLPANVLQDQKAIWSFPVQLAKGNHWKPALGFAAVTAGLLALDPHDTPYFRRTTSFNGFNKVFSGTNASLGMALVPASFLVAGLARHDSYAEHTALLVGEAVADTGILSLVIKDSTHRVRPSDLSPTANFSDTWTEARGSALGKNASFPSGHAIEAFSIATVFARRYRQHRWAPWVAYGTASAVAFSRISLQSHFPSDVFAGAALGYFISRSVVLQNH